LAFKNIDKLHAKFSLRPFRETKSIQMDLFQLTMIFFHNMAAKACPSDAAILNGIAELFPALV
jgi:hypothetical protein